MKLIIILKCLHACCHATELVPCSGCDLRDPDGKIFLPRDGYDVDAAIRTCFEHPIDWMEDASWLHCNSSLHSRGAVYVTVFMNSIDVSGSEHKMRDPCVPTETTFPPEIFDHAMGPIMTT